MQNLLHWAFAWNILRNSSIPFNIIIERGQACPPVGITTGCLSACPYEHNRSVFSFCMCPGGIIAPAATNDGEIVVNGWSPSKRNNPFANSGIVVNVEENDWQAWSKYGAFGRHVFSIIH